MWHGGIVIMKRAGIFFTEGFEEIEALTVVDLLRRAGIEALCVSTTGSMEATGSHKIKVAMDVPEGCPERKTLRNALNLPII